MSETSSPPANSEGPTDGRYTVIARRYRPQAFDELVGQEHVARALQQAISSNRVGHAYLFTGARGVGKTSAARILAKALNCVEGPTPTPCNKCDVCLRVTSGDDVDVLEIDGASNRGIDEIRQLRQNVAVRPSRVRYKIYIIDEVHMLTKEAFNALLKTLEEPPEHVKFIFATTEPQKIPITILSRCQRFDFAGVEVASIQARLGQIAAAEGVEVEPEALQILASRAAGSMRDSQSLLEQLLAMGHAKISAADVNQLLGIAPAERLGVLVRYLVARDASAALAELDATIASGVEVGLLLDQLVGYFRDVMTIAVGCAPAQMLYALPSQAVEVAEIGRQLGLSSVLAIGQILDHTGARLRVSMHARTLVEMAIVRICQIGELDDIAAVIAELRGEAPSPPPAKPAGPAATPAPAAASTGSLAASLQAQVDLKKNVEPRPVASAPPATSSPSVPATNPYQRAAERPQPAPSAPVAPPTAAAAPAPPAPFAPTPVAPAPVTAAPVAATPPPEQTVRRDDPPHTAEQPAAATNGSAEPPAPPAPRESSFERLKQAMANGGLPKSDAPPRPSRREQLSQVAEQPFVKRAMELFDVPPDKLRYSPPENKSD